jgi:diguanylate cyclase (GGDEF)-like protein
LLVGNTLIGVLTLYSANRDAFTEEHERVLEIVGRQVAPAIQQTPESQHSRSAVFRDEVTGLPQLEHFRDLATAQISEASAHRPVSLLLINLAGLQQTVSGHGLTHRSDVVTAIVRATRRNLRAADLLFRHRDDELVALLLQTGEAIGKAIALRIEEAVESEQGRIELRNRFGVTVSVVSAPGDGRSVEELLEKAAGHTRHSNGRSTSSGDSPSRAIH